MKNTFTIILFAFICTSGISQNTADSIKADKKLGFSYSGYIQAQYQHFLIPDSVGSATSTFAYFAGSNFANRFTSNRFTIRRGRLKFMHTSKISNGVLSFDITERGFSVKDLYVSVSDPYIQAFTFTAGIFNRPFGYELGYSSSDRESPERSRVIQTVFPNERDLGAKIGFRMPEKSALHFLKLEAGIINGNSTNYETNDYKDIVGRVSAETNSNNKKFKASGGFSFYSGSIDHIYEPVDTFSSNTTTKYYVYSFGTINDSLSTKGFLIDSVKTKSCGTTGGKIDRKYWGFDAQFELNSPIGKLVLRGEYIAGTQPASVNYNNLDKDYIIYNGMNTFSPTGPFLGVSWPMYDQPQPYNPVAVGPVNKYHNTFIRKFNGGSLMFIQNIKETGHQIVFKYDWYDPNTDVKGKEIDIVYYASDDSTVVGPTYLSPADVKFTTIGLGWNWQIDEHVKLMLYCDMVQNEKTKIKPYNGDIKLGRLPSPGFDKDIKDDVVTIRLQYKF